MRRRHFQTLCCFLDVSRDPNQDKSNINFKLLKWIFWVYFKFTFVQNTSHISPSKTFIEALCTWQKADTVTRPANYFEVWKAELRAALWVCVSNGVCVCVCVLQYSMYSVSLSTMKEDESQENAQLCHNKKRERKLTYFSILSFLSLGFFFCQLFLSLLCLGCLFLPGFVVLRVGNKTCPHFNFQSLYCTVNATSKMPLM